MRLSVITFLLWTFCSIIPLQLPAQETAPNTTQSKDDILPPSLSEELKRAEKLGDSRFLDEFMSMLFMLGVIVIFIMIFMWILKRMLNVRVEQMNKTSAIKVLEKRTLSPKTTVYVLGVFGKAVAIAESLNGITLLSEISLKQMQEEKALSNEKQSQQNQE